MSYSIPLNFVSHLASVRISNDKNEQSSSKSGSNQKQENKKPKKYIVPIATTEQYR